VWRGTAEYAFSLGLCHHECRRPSRSNVHPCFCKRQISASHFIPAGFLRSFPCCFARFLPIDLQRFCKRDFEHLQYFFPRLFLAIDARNLGNPSNPDFNTAVGSGALQINQAGTSNTALGAAALLSNITGGNNTAVGYQALENATGNNNIALGTNSGVNLTSGNNNIYIGHQGTNESGIIRIGTPGTHTSTFLSGNVFASSFTSSDARLKANIMPLTNVLERLEQLRGVSFEWNDTAAPLTGHTPGQRDLGVIAQEVEAVFPELVTTWGDEGYKAVSYEKLTGVLIAAVKELKADRDTQQQHIVALEARLAALEQTAETRQPAGRLSFSSLSDGWPLFGGLLLVGLVLGRRWQAGGRRK
jgi:Chaperone of endosialidase